MNPCRGLGAPVAGVLLLLLNLAGCAPGISDFAGQVNLPTYVIGVSGAAVSMEGTWLTRCVVNGPLSYRNSVAVSGTDYTATQTQYNDTFCGSTLGSGSAMLTDWNRTGECTATKSWTNVGAPLAAGGTYPDPAPTYPTPRFSSMGGTNPSDGLFYVDSWFVDDTLNPHRLFVGSGSTLDACGTQSTMDARYFERQ